MITGENREHKFTLRKHEVRHLVDYLICDDMEDDFALRYVRIYPGVNSRAELVTLA